MEGWIKLHRKFLTWEWFHKSEMVQLFLYFLLECNYEDKKWQGILIKRGSFITSLQSINENTGLSKQVIRTCIERLKSTHEITHESTNHYTVITICNYDTYQIVENEINTQINTQINKPITNEQQTDNKPLTTTKEEEEVKKERKKKNIDSVFLPPSIDEVRQYFKENGYAEFLADKFFNGYSVANWIDSKGNKVKNWKQKAIQVWFKDENKIKVEEIELDDYGNPCPGDRKKHYLGRNLSGKTKWTLNS